MSTPEPNRTATNEQLLDLAHDCFSAVLQFDYWSTGVGHQQSTAFEQRRRSAPQASDAHGRRCAHTPAQQPVPNQDVIGPMANSAQAPAPTRHDAATPDIVRQYLSEVATRRRLSSSEEYRLARAACDGDAAARQQLIEHQLGLVVMIARPYRNRGLPLLDLIEEGNLGLMQALSKFDPERGCRFSTYAKWWVRQAIELALMTQTRVVHIPVHLSRALKRQNRTARFEPTPRTAPRSPEAQPTREVGKLMLFEAVETDLSGEQLDGEPRSLVDSLPDSEHQRPDSHAQLTYRRRRLNAVLAELSSKEKRVIEWRFGLFDDETLTLESIAERLELSSERVRQIQSAALTKLRTLLAADTDSPDQDLL